MNLLALAAFAGLVYLLRFCSAPTSWARTVTKTLSVAALALAAGLSGAPGPLVLALSLCALGDYLLSRDTEQTLLAGVGAFAAGHLAYIAVFASVPGFELGHLVTGLGLLFSAFLAVYGAVMMWQLFRRAGPLRFAVMAYVPIIVAMGLCAYCVPALGELGLILPAAILFMLSDSILAAELFLLRADHPLRQITPYLIWASYWLAQLGFFWAFAAPLQ
jgi:uncharacterized membrane protein YhhN